MGRDMHDEADFKRAFVVDDDDAFRGSLVALLESAEWSVQAFASAEDFLSNSNGLGTGLLLLDLNLGDRSGLDLLESGSIELARFGVVMITGAGDIQTAVRSIKAGALDFVEKPFAAAEALQKLDHIHEIFRMSLRANARAAGARQRVEKLSGRERDVLERLLSGASNKHIARDLDLSPRTVEMHRARMLQKLGVKSTPQAVELARLAGLEPVAPGGVEGSDAAAVD